MATKLRMTRFSQGLSAQHLSTRSGVHYLHLLKIEKGEETAWPKARRAIAEALGLAEEELFDERGFAQEVQDAK